MDTKNTEEEFFITRDDLRDYIHQIHDDLRNAGAGYGQTGLKIFSVFYGLKLIKPNLKKLKIKDEYKEVLDWDKLVERADKKEEIIEYIDTKVLDALFELKEDCKKTGNRDSEVGHFIFHQIPTDISDDIYKNLILKINKIPVGFKGNDKVNLSGKLWEYFVGRDKTAISELGAYFTDRPVTNYIFERLKPTLDDDNNVHTMIDPYGGSGGFTLGYANYFRSNYKDINWKNNVDNIYHFDMEETVVKMTGLEMFAITGYFPKRDNKCNFTRGNTFQEEFVDKNNDPKKYHYVISNPPYGGDKKKKNAQDIKRDKIIEYLKSMKDLSGTKKTQLSKLLTEKKTLEAKQKAEQTVNKATCSKRINAFCKTHKIDVANDKEACSLILLMDLLEKNGTCVGVLKEGVFFDGKYSKVREVLLKNYNVTDIISIPSNAFENTTTKTSIIIFHNNGPTKKIKFSQLIIHKVKEDVFEEDENGEVILTKVKEDFDRIEEKSFSEATIKHIKELKTKNRCIYSLNAKDYKDYKVVCPEGYELKKLGEFLKYEKKSKRDAAFANENGKYRFYTSSDKVKKCDECDFNSDKLKLIFGTGGAGSLFIDDKFSCSADNFVCTTDNKYDMLYIYDYIKTNWKDFINKMFNGSTLGHVNKDRLDNCEIPFPKDITKLKPQLDKLYKLHQQIAQNTKDIPEKEKAICNIIKSATDSGKKDVDYEEYKLGDIIETQAGKFNTKDMSNSGNYPFYNASVNSLGYHDKYCFDGEKYILLVKSGNINANGIGSVVFVKNKIAAVSDILMVINKNKTISINYIYYILNIIKYDMRKTAKTTTGLAHLSINEINNIKIKVLTEKQMKKLKLQELFDEVDELKETLEKNKDQYKNMMKEMFKDFEEDEIENEIENESNSNSDNESDKSDGSESESESSEEKLKKKVKTKEVKQTKLTKQVTKNTKKQETSSESSESESSEDEPVKKPVKEVKPVKKTKQTKKQETSSEDELPKKKAKATAKSK